MISFNTFVRSKNGLLTKNEVKDLSVDYGESITDKSHYNPNASSFVSNQGFNNVKPLYHFSDGIDNGLNMALITNKNLDVTEKEAVYNHLKTKVGIEVKNLLEKQLEEEEQSDTDDIAVTKKTEKTDNS